MSQEQEQLSDAKTSAPPKRQVQFSVKRFPNAATPSVQEQRQSHTTANNAWKIASVKTPMLNQPELDRLGDQLGVHLLPEMIFNNKLDFHHVATGIHLEFNAPDALRLARHDALHPFRDTYLPRLKVGHAWDTLKKQKEFAQAMQVKQDLLKARSNTQQQEMAIVSSLSNLQISPQNDANKGGNNSTPSPQADSPSDSVASASGENNEKVDEREDNIDWTFTTVYWGSAIDGSVPVVVEPTNSKIDYEKLKKKEPILFYEDLVLYEDELHDCGDATLSVKTRVMSKYFFVLLRFFLRVDNVIVRMVDNRFYHEFGSDHVLREFSVRQEKFSKLGKIVTSDPKLMTDPARLEPLLPLVHTERYKIVLNEKQIANAEKQPDSHPVQLQDASVRELGPVTSPAAQVGVVPTAQQLKE